MAIVIYTFSVFSLNYNNLYSLYLAYLALQYISQFFIYSSTSLLNPFYRKSLIIISIVFAIPRCPAVLSSYLAKIIRFFYSSINSYSIIIIPISSLLYSNFPSFILSSIAGSGSSPSIQSTLLLRVSTVIFSIPRIYIILKSYRFSVSAY